MFGKQSNNKGFTLVEILMVMLILGILTQMGFTYFKDLKKRSFDSVAIADGKNLMNAVGTAFALLEDVDLTHTSGMGSEVGSERFSGGGREPIFTLSVGVKAEITGQSESSPGNGYVSAYLYHEEGTEDPDSFTGSGRKEFYFMIDEFSSTISLAD
jgi:prepilin-type N-terminal cleavage/methylation domain-containing protein